jgi:hypothetical protein
LFGTRSWCFGEEVAVHKFSGLEITMKVVIKAPVRAAQVKQTGGINERQMGGTPWANPLEMLTVLNPFDDAIDGFSKSLLYCLAFYGPKNQRPAFEAWPEIAGLGISVYLCLYLTCAMISNESELKPVGVTDCAVGPTVLLCIELRGQPSPGTGPRFIQLGQQLTLKEFAQCFSEPTINRALVIRSSEGPEFNIGEGWVHASCRTMQTTGRRWRRASAADPASKDAGA